MGRVEPFHNPLRKTTNQKSNIKRVGEESWAKMGRKLGYVSVC